MAMIQKRKRADGSFSYRVRVKYRDRVLTSTHRDFASAKRWAAERSAQIRNDAHFAGEGNRRRLLGDLIDRYLEHVVQQKRDQRNQRRQLAWWKKKLGSLPLGHISRSLIAQHRDELLRHGPALAIFLGIGSGTAQQTAYAEWSSTFRCGRCGTVFAVIEETLLGGTSTHSSVEDR